MDKTRVKNYYVIFGDILELKVFTEGTLNFFLSPQNSQNTVKILIA